MVARDQGRHPTLTFGLHTQARSHIHIPRTQIENIEIKAQKDSKPASTGPVFKHKYLVHLTPKLIPLLESVRMAGSQIGRADWLQAG